MNETRTEELTDIKNGFLEIMESYNLTFGEMCGLFEDIKFDILMALREEEE